MSGPFLCRKLKYKREQQAGRQTDGRTYVDSELSKQLRSLKIDTTSWTPCMNDFRTVYCLQKKTNQAHLYKRRQIGRVGSCRRDIKKTIKEN